MGRFTIGYSSLLGMNFISFSEVLALMTGLVEGYLRNEEMGRDWCFFYSVFLPDSFYIKF